MLGPDEVLYEDNHLLVVNKQAGYLVQGDITGDKPLVEHCKDYIQQKYHKPGKVFCGVIHRLDRPVSGAVAFARTSKALERMNKLFREKKVTKTYWAIVKQNPPDQSGQLTHWLVKDRKANKTTAHWQEVRNSQKAELIYKVVGQTGGHYLLEVYPLTGRPHQIRVQLSALGCPIRGDLKYGFPEANADGNINLHSLKLSFDHPVKREPLHIFAPVPKEPPWDEFLKQSWAAVQSSTVIQK